MINVLFAAGETRWPHYQAPLENALSAAGIHAHISRDITPDEVDYIIAAPNADISDFGPYTNCKLVQHIWAGVEGYDANTTLTQPLARMVDPGLTQGMREWVVGHVLRHHLRMDAHIHGQDGIWRKDIPPLASDRIATVLGLGELGSACAKTLAHLGFQVRGWSRSAKTMADIETHHGPTGLRDALTDADIVILLLPLTDATENILGADEIAMMKEDAVIINAGRGHLIDDKALLAALDTGALGHATLDVFRTEPLPADHPFWHHPRVTVTPHIASETRPETACPVIAENIRRGEAGEPFLHLVDRDAGY